MQQRVFGRTMVAALLVGLVLTSVLVGCQQRSPTPEPAEASTPRGGGARVISTPAPDEEFMSLEEAERRVSFRILQPAYLPEGVTLSRVRVPGAGKPGKQQAVYLIYSNGLTIRQVVTAPPLEGEYEIVASEGSHVLLEVNGVPGIGSEPEDVKAIGGTVHNRGNVFWWVDGKGFAVVGDLSLKELLRIAESLQ